MTSKKGLLSRIDTLADFSVFRYAPKREKWEAAKTRPYFRRHECFFYGSHQYRLSLR
jgi:hypothetical protein